MKTILYFALAAVSALAAFATRESDVSTFGLYLFSMATWSIMAGSCLVTSDEDEELGL